MVDTECTKLGHPLPCSAAMSHSKFGVKLINYIRSTSVHYSTLRNMLSNVYHDVRKCYSTIYCYNGRCITKYQCLVIT